MTVIPINTKSRDYEVRIGAGLLDTLGDAVRSCTKARRCVLVAGENVSSLYGERAAESLRRAGLEVHAVTFPSGEETKCLRYYGELLEFMASHKLTRSDCAVALGGGVTGDLTGFAAATYQRGIDYIQVPTTLLAAVDSSVGGKTAIDLPEGKNQVGAFWQPGLVLCDTETLSTLPERELRAGMAEVIKYAVLGNPEFFRELQEAAGDTAGDAAGVPNDGTTGEATAITSGTGMELKSIEHIIETCVRMKAEIVREDETDRGRRRLLNLGHSFGHAVESRSSYQLLHGEAVSIGMAMICRAAVRLKYLEPSLCENIIGLLRAHGLPTENPYAPGELVETMLLDKKFSSGKLTLIVPEGVGSCLEVPVPASELPAWLDAASERSL